MLINVSFDQAQASLPTGFVTAVNYVVSYFDHLFTDNITVNIHVGFGEVHNVALGPSALGQSETWGSTVSYTNLRNALLGDRKSGDDNLAGSSLPSSDPIVGGHNYWVSLAEQKALGLLSGTNPAVDGYVGFSNSSPFDYDRNDGITSGYYDFIGVVEHEFSEVLGRVALAGQSGTTYEPLDLFDYSSAGTRRFVGANPGYFSIDGGTTNLNNFNTDPTGDFGDWAASAGNDSALAFSNSGVMNIFTPVDVRAMDILGYNRAPATTHDFSGDGLSDILWCYGPTGAVFETQMNGLNTISGTGIGGDLNWSVVATGDFNGDGMTDILWRYGPTGAVFENEMSGSTIIGSASLGGNANWSVVGTGDFNGDGMTDILWRYAPTGAVFEVEMNGTNTIGSGSIGGDSNWSVAGTGDFNGDGKTDILWRYAPTGTVFEVDMNGTTTIGSGSLGGDSNWSVIGTGDFNGDGKSDILWRYAPTNTVFEVDMNGTTTIGSRSLGGDANWSVAGIGDFNGDGKADILWRYAPTGTVFQVDMNGTTTIASGSLGGDANWRPVTV